MTVGIRGILVHRSGWSGSVTVDDGVTPTTVNPTGSASAHDWLLDLQAAAQSAIDPSFALGITPDGYYQLTCDAAFTLDFSSAPVANRFGFSSASYASATTRTAEAVAPGGWYPYATDAFFQSIPAPIASAQATRLYASAHRQATPALLPSAPEIRAWTLRAASHGLITALSYATTPAQLDVIIDDMTSTAYHISSISASESGVLGWTEHRISVTEVL